MNFKRKNQITVFFDFNGTIIDDVELCFNILNKMLEESDLNPISLERYKEIFDFPIKKYYKKSGFDFSKTSFEDLSKEFIELYQVPSMKCSLHEGCIDVLKKLNSKKVNVVLLTASKTINVVEQLKKFKIMKYFNSVLGTSDIYAKSKVEIGMRYINENNIDKDNSIMVGDTTHDYEVSKNMGIKCILFSQGHQSKNRLEKTGCDVINSLNEIFKYINTCK